MPPPHTPSTRPSSAPTLKRSSTARRWRLASPMACTSGHHSPACAMRLFDPSGGSPTVSRWPLPTATPTACSSMPCAKCARRSRLRAVVAEFAGAASLSVSQRCRATATRANGRANNSASTASATRCRPSRSPTCIATCLPLINSRRVELLDHPQAARAIGRPRTPYRTWWP